MFMGINMHLVISYECQFLRCWNVKDNFSPSEPYVMSRSKVIFTFTFLHFYIYKQGKSILSYFA